MSDIVHHMKYAKYLSEIQRRETWEETIDRNKMMHIKRYPFLKKEIDAAFEMVYQKKVFPSMRSIQFAGKPIEINNARLYNCCFLPIDDYRAFSETMFLLLSGCGVGYSVQKQHVDKLPEINRPKDRKRKYVIGDSIEGWSDAIKVLLKSYFLGKSTVVFDYSDIREKGAKLITSGGKAPGPQPLHDCLHNIKKILEPKRTGEKLTTLECHDILCYIADAVLSGGIRRCLEENSLIHTENGLEKIKDIKLGTLVQTKSGMSPVTAKQYTGEKQLLELDTQVGTYFSTPEHRWAVVNSLDGDVTWKRADELTKKDALYFSREILEVKNEVESLSRSFGNNTLRVPDFVMKGKEETRISFLTGLLGVDVLSKLETKDKQGPIISSVHEEFLTDVSFLVKSLGIPCKVVSSKPINMNGQNVCSLCFVDSFVETLNEFYPVCINNISKGEVKRTYDISVKDEEMFVYGGLLVHNSACISLFSFDDEDMISSKFGKWYEKHPHRARSNNSAVILRHRIEEPEFKTFWEKIKNNNTGEPGIYFSHNQDMGINPCKPLNSLILTPKGYITFREAMKLPNETFNIIGENGKVLKAKKPFLTGKNKGVWRIKLSNGMYLYGTKNHLHKDVDGNWKRIDELQVGDYLRIEIKVLSIEKDYSFEDVYDIEVLDDSHAFIDSGVVSHNCNEKSLKPFQFCNLTTFDSSKAYSQQDFNQMCKAAAFIGTLQASYTDFHYLRDIWKRNTEKEALLGVSMTGICSGQVLALDIEQGANIVLEENRRVAKLLGINISARSCVIKPEGTVSLIAGTSSGIHPWHSPYYIRRVRVGKNEAIYGYLKQNHPELIEDDYFKPHLQAVISIPMKSPTTAIFRTEEETKDFLERVLKFHKEWVRIGHRKGQNTDNVSATISVRPEEWDMVGDWLWDNRDGFNGLSVLPWDGGTYIQAPLEECSEEMYKTLFGKLKNIDITKIIEVEDNTDLQGELACAGGSCEVI